jgi:hypothetical protein
LNEQAEQAGGQDHHKDQNADEYDRHEIRAPARALPSAL